MDRILKINLFKEQPQRVNKKKYEKVNNNVKTPQVKSTEINNIPQEIKTVKLKHSYDIYKKTANFTILNVRLENVNMKIEVFYMIDCANQQKCEVKELQDNCLLQKSYEFNFAHVDRHALEDEFTVQLSFSVQENIISRVLRRKYKFDIPFFDNNTYLDKNKKCADTPHKVNKSIENLNTFGFKDDGLLATEEKELLGQIMAYHNKRDSSFSYEMLRNALDIEICSTLKDCHLRLEMEFSYVELKRKSSGFAFKVDIKFHADEWKDYELYLIKMESLESESTSERTKGIIKDYKNGEVYFEVHKTALCIKKLYHIRFQFFSSSYQVLINTLLLINTHHLQNYFLEFDVAPEKCPITFKDHKKVEILEWFDKRVESNNEQMMAIKNIVNCTAYPFPFIIFGPPGTGKTSTLVECVAQILQHKPDSRILITAQSNSACDEIGVRLIKAVDRKKIFRIYASSQLKNQESTEMRKELLKISNLRGNREHGVTCEQIKYFNVVIVTLMKSNLLTTFKNRYNYYDYIFVDECASATEIECLVPIMGLGTSLEKITTNIVFSGDHKQLGPVINSKFAEKLGLGVSLMERMMTKKRYKDCPSYDNNYIVQLLDNYRNHPAILHFPNEQFYDSKLRAKAPQQDDGKFPIVFHCVRDPSKIEFNGTSSYNNLEVIIVKKYVVQLLRKGFKEQDIGIISPYKAQLSKLRTILGKLIDIEIGTAEYYQGREKNIIIISTVKSRSSVDFLKSEKRFNVMLTRAKSKLIIVGNPETLIKDRMWKKFINYCENNDAFIGRRFKKKSKDKSNSLKKVTESLKVLGLVEENSE